MSFWTDVRSPVIGGLVGGPVGLGVGLAYDASQGQGFFGGGAPSGGGGNPYAGMSSYPTYNPTFTPGMAVGPNGQSQRTLENYANSPGPSPWSNLMNTQQDALLAQNRDVNAKTNAGQTNQALSNLAASGGLSSGARERAIEQGQKGEIGADQDASRQADLNKLQIGVNDEQNKLSTLGSVGNIENTDALANMTANMSNNSNLNNWNMNLYKTNMDTWASGQQANATANSGKK